MSERKKLEYPKGLFFKESGANAPDWVVAKMSIKRRDLLGWLNSKEDEWINFDVCRGSSGDSIYARVDDWKPDVKKAESIIEDDLPF